MSRRVEGLRSWIWQRISALYLTIFTLYFVTMILFGVMSDYHSWRAWVSQPFINILFIIFFIMLFVHAWVGARDVVMDYVRSLWLRITVLLMIGLGLLICLVWVGRILVQVMM